ncbi:unnamed protein product [Adineta steineri]|uniref:Uncharacterized protein n=1 Tax=Adineta steineri TaxID=433720 RepID=A0A814HIG0_9BILA|nr:unnamed protein product [Adineta steineri]CAF4088018.1 unnamed protein product [Adineta steineri]
MKRVSLISYLLSFILYIIAFSIFDWIVYTTVSAKSTRTYSSNATNTPFMDLPDFIRTSQSLEVVALIVYVIARISLLIVLFASATIGLFAGQGKTPYMGYL